MKGSVIFSSYTLQHLQRKFSYIGMSELTDSQNSVDVILKNLLFSET